MFAEAGKKVAENVMKNSGRALQTEVKIRTAAITKTTKIALSIIPDVTFLSQTAKYSSLGKTV